MNDLRTEMTPHRVKSILFYLFHILSGYNDGLVQDYRISTANALEILQSCTKPSIYNAATLQWRYMIVMASTMAGE